MNVDEAFDEFQEFVNADDDEVVEARRRRDLFTDAFEAEPDVDKVFPSGSLARGTHKTPIHDVDLVILFAEEERHAWGSPGDSAEEALDHVRERVNTLLGVTHGERAKAVRLARPRNHAVKCFLDDPEVDGAFTVDVMPALAHDNHLLIPEKLSRTWVESDPEFLINEVAKAHDEWNYFAKLVRVLKVWSAGLDVEVKSLVMEVLALQLLPRDGDRPDSLGRFFAAASYFVESNVVEDPANLCGPIQDDLDYDALADSLGDAANLAAQALAAQAQGDIARAVNIWREIFGTDFPEAPEDDLITPDDDSGDGQSSVSPSLIGAPTLIQPRPVKDAPQG